MLLRSCVIGTERLLPDLNSLKSNVTKSSFLSAGSSCAQLLRQLDHTGEARWSRREVNAIFFWPNGRKSLEENIARERQVKRDREKRNGAITVSPLRVTVGNGCPLLITFESFACFSRPLFKDADRKKSSSIVLDFPRYLPSSCREPPPQCRAR